MRKHSFIQFSARKISEPTQSGHGSEIFFSPKSAPRIALVASIAWVLWNYRLSMIQALEAAGYEVLLIAAEDDSCQQLSTHTRAHFVPLHELSRRSLSPWQNLKSLLEMRRLFRQYRPDLVLFFTIRPNTLGNIAAAFTGIRSISTVEGMGISGTHPWLRRIAQSLYYLAFRHSSNVVFLNQEDLKTFVHQGIVAASKAVLIHGPGLDLGHFAPRPKVGATDKTVFIFMARLLSEKGIREYVDAARILKAKGLNLEFHVLGAVDPGNPTSILKDELNSWIKEDIIRYLGFVEDVRPALAEADFMVLPSYYREGVPRSVLEAMSMEKPVITTDNVGCRDTVEEGKNGFLIEPKSVAALTDAMARAYALDAETRTAMGRYSRQMAAQAFGDEWVIPKYLSLIREILAT